MSDGKKVDFFMPLYIGDYLADTSHLSAEEHGAYLLLLMAAWRREGRLPNDQVFLSRMAAVPRARWQRVWGIIAHFFTVDGDTITQDRLCRELARATRINDAASRGGKASARARDKTANLSDSKDRGPKGLDVPLGTDRATRGQDPQPQPDLQPDPDLPPGGSGGEITQDGADKIPMQTPTKTESSQPASSGASGGASGRWSGGRWLERFRAAFWEAKGRQYGRGETDARAASDLTDRLAEIADAARAELELAAPKVFAVYFAMNGSVGAASHPFKWFAERSNEWPDWVSGRSTGLTPARAAVGYAVVRGGKDWEAGMDRVKKR